MKILAYKPDHDGATTYIDNGELVFSYEAEKDSNYRYSPLSVFDIFRTLGEINDLPDVICSGGWWPRDAQSIGKRPYVGYRGIENNGIAVTQGRLFGKSIHNFSSTHERSHLLCAFGMSDLPKGSPCYALVWEGNIGAFYEIGTDFTITLLGDVLNQPGNRYASIYGLADPTFSKNAPFSRFSDAGKLMALASFSKRCESTSEEDELMEFILGTKDVRLDLYNGLETSRYFNVGVDDTEFRNFAGIFSNRIFDIFYEFAKENLRKRLPLVIAGGCGLNCDWNTKWKDSNLFESVFVPPVANDSGSSIGTAIDAQLYFTGNPKITWDVYSGLEFDDSDPIDLNSFDVSTSEPQNIAELLANDLILGWVNGKCEIGPRALGNRSIIAAPFREETRIRLNVIKQREQFRPIAPVCTEEDALRWFACAEPSPYMLYTYVATTDRLAAVTHVNQSARIQTVSPTSNKQLHDLLNSFKTRTGFGVLCNTSLNFKGRGFINSIRDLALYVSEHQLDGFVVGEKCYLLKSAKMYIEYLRRKKNGKQ